MRARCADGVELAIDHVAAQGRARGAVVCLHAMMTDGRYFGARHPDGFAAHLAAQGLDVWVADFRGHGRSAAPGVTDWSFDDLVELDLPAIVAAIDRPASELVILGHSLGGLVASAAVGAQRIAPPRALVLAATSVWLGGGLRRRALMAAYRAAATVLGRAPIRRLGLGHVDEPRTYVRQLTGWSASGRWTDRYGKSYADALARITAPTFAFSGTRDWMCTPDDARGFLAQIPGAPHVSGSGTVRLVDGADHFELFTDPGRIKLRAEIVEVVTDVR